MVPLCRSTTHGAIRVSLKSITSLRYANGCATGRRTTRGPTSCVMTLGNGGGTASSIPAISCATAAHSSVARSLSHRRKRREVCDLGNIVRSHDVQAPCGSCPGPPHDRASATSGDSLCTHHCLINCHDYRSAFDGHRSSRVSKRVLAKTSAPIAVRSVTAIIRIMRFVTVVSVALTSSMLTVMLVVLAVCSVPVPPR